MADEALSAGAVARRLGVAVTTLRTWHQRYGLGPSHHVPGHHRRYTPEDLARLEIMRRLTAEGVAPAEAAALGPARAADVPPATGADGRPAPASAPDGGLAIPVGRAGPAARGLARAAMRLDATAMRDILERAVADHGVVSTWDDRDAAGARRHRRAARGHQAADRGRAPDLPYDHRGRSASVPRPRRAPPARILLACADEEQHTPAAGGAGGRARREGRDRRRLLGARVPPSARSPTRSTAPDRPPSWSGRRPPTTADPTQLRALLHGPRRPMLVVAGRPGLARRRAARRGGAAGQPRPRRSRSAASAV